MGNELSSNCCKNTEEGQIPNQGIKAPTLSSPATSGDSPTPLPTPNLSMISELPKRGAPMSLFGREASENTHPNLQPIQARNSRSEKSNSSTFVAKPESSFSSEPTKNIQVLRLSDGSQYVGEALNSKAHGKGKLTWPTGEVYEGCFENGVKNGFGRLTLKNGDVYEGEFARDMYNGFGTMNISSKGIYSGEWKDNQMHGQGQFTYNDGRLYIGGFDNDMKQGDGEYRWPDGKVYKGQFFNNKQHGEGTYIKNGNQITGRWENGVYVKQK